MKKSDKTYFADVQADILKYVGRMGQHDSFGRFEANIDGFDYIMYVVANGAVGWFIPYQYDALSGIEQFEKYGRYGDIPDYTKSLITDKDIVECKMKDVTYDDHDKIKVAEFCADGYDSMFVNFNFVKDFVQSKDFSFKYSKFDRRLSLYVYKGGSLVSIVMTLRKVK